MALRLLPSPSGKPTLVHVPARRRSSGKHGKKHHGFRKHLSFFSKPWVRLAMVLVVADALAVTMLSTLPKIISPQALVFWLYGSWKKNKSALALATVFQAGRIASVMGITAGVASASAGFKLTGFSGGGGSSGNPLADLLGGGGGGGGSTGSELADLLTGGGGGGGDGSGGGGGGDNSAPGGQSSDDQGNPVPA